MPRHRIALIVALSFSSACSTTPECDPPLRAQSFQKHELSYLDSSRATPQNGSFVGAPTRTLTTTLWLPDGDSAVPLILHSHGLSDTRIGETYFIEALAALGYAVAAFDFPLSSMNAPGGPSPLDVASQPGDVAFVLAQLAQSMFAARLDLDRVGLSGLSLGGLTTLLATYHPTLRIPTVKAALVMAPLGCFFAEQFYTHADVPLAVLHGDNDLIVPYAANGRRIFDRAQHPGLLATFEGGTHLGFTGFGLFFAGENHPDLLGCDFVPKGGAQFQGIGDPSVGITTGECPGACEEMGAAPTLDATTQQEATVAIGRAFFGEHLRGEKGNACVPPEVTLQTRK